MTQARQARRGSRRPGPPIDAPAASQPADEAHEPAEDRRAATCDDEGPVRRIERRRDRLTERRPAAVGKIESEQDAMTHADDGRDAEARSRVARRRRQARGGGPSRRGRGRGRSRGPPQPIDPKSHSPRKSTSPIVSSRSGDEEEAEGDGGQRHHPLDLVEDLARLGLGQVDMGSDEALAGPNVAPSCSRIPGGWPLDPAETPSLPTGSPRSGRPAPFVGSSGCTLPPVLVRPDSSSAGYSRSPAKPARGGVSAGTLRGMRTLTTAEILSIGSELTVGETRDTNAGDLARALTDRGVVVVRITAMPDDLAAVRDAFLAALAAGRPRRLDGRPRTHAR